MRELEKELQESKKEINELKSNPNVSPNVSNTTSTRVTESDKGKKKQPVEIPKGETSQDNRPVDVVTKKNQ